MKHKTIFVSSTFKDFHHERDLINNEILNKINIKLRETLGINIDFLDLRWGIDASEDNDNQFHKVISICTEEVKKTKPFYILFMGDRYGSIVDKQIAKAIYNYNNINYDGLEKSITEIEAEVSPLFTTDNEYCLVLDREIIDLDSGNEIFVENLDKEMKFKDKVKTYCKADNYLSYKASYNKHINDIYLSESDKICEFIYNKLIKFLEEYNLFVNKTNELQVNINDELYTLDNNIFDTLIEQRNETFVGRSDELNQLKDLLGKDKVTWIKAPSGIGKTSFICNIVKYLRINKVNVISFFAGDSYSDPTLINILLFYCKEILRLYPKLQKDNLNEYYRLRDTIIKISFGEVEVMNFLIKLIRIKKDHQFYLIIDAEDKVLTEDQNEFNNIINELSSVNNINVIISTTRDVKRGFELGNFRYDEEVVAFISKRARVFKKTIPNGFWDMFKNYKENLFIKMYNPIYLSLLTDDLIFLGYDDYKKISLITINNDYNSSLAKVLLDKVIESPIDLKDVFYKKFTSLKQESINSFTMLKALVCSKYGLNMAFFRKYLNMVGLCASSVDLLLLQYRFYGEIFKLSNGVIRCNHDLFTNTFISFIEDEIEETRKNYLDVLMIRLADAKINQEKAGYLPSEILKQYDMLNDYVDLSVLIEIMNSSQDDELFISKLKSDLLMMLSINKLEESMIYKLIKANNKLSVKIHEGIAKWPLGVIVKLLPLYELMVPCFKDVAICDEKERFYLNYAVALANVGEYKNSDKYFDLFRDDVEELMKKTKTSNFGLYVVRYIICMIFRCENNYIYGSSGFFYNLIKGVIDDANKRSDGEKDIRLFYRIGTLICDFGEMLHFMATDATSGVLNNYLEMVNTSIKDLDNYQNYQKDNLSIINIIYQYIRLLTIRCAVSYQITGISNPQYVNELYNYYMNNSSLCVYFTDKSILLLTYMFILPHYDKDSKFDELLYRDFHIIEECCDNMNFTRISSFVIDNIRCFARFMDSFERTKYFQLIEEKLRLLLINNHSSLLFISYVESLYFCLVDSIINDCEKDISKYSELYIKLPLIKVNDHNIKESLKMELTNMDKRFIFPFTDICESIKGISIDKVKTRYYEVIKPLLEELKE